MIGKILTLFSNHWKKIQALFQSLEKDALIKTVFSCCRKAVLIGFFPENRI